MKFINLVPRPPPRLYLAAVELAPAFLHGCEIKSGWRPGYEVRNLYAVTNHVISGE